MCLNMCLTHFPQATTKTTLPATERPIRGLFPSQNRKLLLRTHTNLRADASLTRR